MSYTITRYAKGTIWWCNLLEDNMLSYMQKGRRPVLIISNSETNEIEHACTVLPISTSDKYENYLDTHQVVKYEYNDLTSYVMCNMPRRISVFKLDRYYGTLSDELFNKVMFNYFYYYDCADVKPSNRNTSLFSNIAELIKCISATSSTDVSMVNDIPVVEKSIVKTAAPIMENAVDKKENVETEKVVISNFSDKNKFTKTNSVISTYKKPYKRTYNKSNSIEGKKTDTFISEVTKNTDKPERRKSAVEHGYWSKKENNIEFWNEILIGDIASIIKKYKFNNRTDVSRRKYRVKQFLLDSGYTPENLKTFIEK